MELSGPKFKNSNISSKKSFSDILGGNLQSPKKKKTFILQEIELSSPKSKKFLILF